MGLNNLTSCLIDFFSIPLGPTMALKIVFDTVGNHRSVDFFDNVGSYRGVEENWIPLGANVVLD